MISAFAYINYRGAEETGKAGVIVTGIRVIILGLFIGFGILGDAKGEYFDELVTTD